MTDPVPSLVDTGRGLTVVYRDRHLYSAHDPRSAPERTAAGAAIPEKSLVLVFSPLLWYGVREILARLPPSSVLLCVEADQALMAMALERLSDDLRADTRFRFIRTDDPAAAASYVAALGTTRFRSIVPLSLNGGYALYRDTYDRIRAALDADLVIAWRNKATILRFGRLWTKNVFANLPLFERSIGELIIGKPAAVIGAGASLESALDWLVRERPSLYLIAADTALAALSVSGIKPDLVVALEAQVANRRDLYGIQTGGMALACDLSSEPSVIRAFSGSTYFFLSDFARLSVFDRMAAAGLLPDPIPPLGSVGVVAAWIARERCRGPIFYAGLDFCFARGKTHARGSPALIAELASAERLSPSGQYAATMRKGSLPLPCPPTADSPNGSRGTAVKYSDPILSSYASQLSSASAPGRVFALRGARTDLGIPVLEFKEASRLLEKFEKTGTAGEAAYRESAPDAAVAPAEARKTVLAGVAFLVSEKERLNRLIGLLSGSEREAGQLLRRLEECDYLYLHFPDTDVPNASPGFVNRVRAEAEYFRRLFSGIIEREGGRDFTGPRRS